MYQSFSPFLSFTPFLLTILDGMKNIFRESLRFSGSSDSFSAELYKFDVSDTFIIYPLSSL